MGRGELAPRRLRELRSALRRAGKIGPAGLPTERDLFQRSHQEDVRDRAAREADRAAQPFDGPVAVLAGVPKAPEAPDVEAERAARATLRAQIAKLEGELSALLAERFPFLAAPVAFPERQVLPAGPHLPGLGELERSRDRLAARLQDLRARAARRSEHERRAAELLERMRLEPGRYRYYRVPVRDLGEGGCGVWEVRPRLGLIGMLAGWWELTLSSGCP